MRIPSNIQRDVVFLGAKLPTGGYNAKGTGFFVSYPSGYKDRWFQFLVTAKHNIDSLIKSKAKEIGIRVNTKSGGAKWVDRPLDKWFTSSDPTCDIILVSISLDELDPEYDWDQLCWPLTSIVDHEYISKWEVREGDEVFTVGLYSRYQGKSKNVPIIRTGNIAAMEQPDIPTRLGEHTRAYLIESRSIGGLSGSPVYINLGSIRYLKRLQTKDVKELTVFHEPQYSLLGVTHGHFEQKDGYEVVNEGIAIVIPATRIIEIIRSPFFLEEMRKRVEELKQLGA